MLVNFRQSLVTATEKTGNFVRDNFRHDIELVNKDAKQELATIDMECHNMVMEILKNDFGTNILSEESSKEQKATNRS